MTAPVRYDAQIMFRAQPAVIEMVHQAAREAGCKPSQWIRSNDHVGSCEIGYYVLEGDLLTMVDSDGVPVRTSGGDLMTHRLASGESEKVVAKRLTLQIFRTARGDEMAGFNRRIDYPKWGGV